jgi:hypothetical protein
VSEAHWGSADPEIGPWGHIGGVQTQTLGHVPRASIQTQINHTHRHTDTQTHRFKQPHTHTSTIRRTEGLKGLVTCCVRIIQT